ncbi:protein decapping 5-like isoform X1 [Solanum pennellii]|uniref:Protein decapping 5-like isoform X1 n=2 Tax=Solanum pennellii TaxID=28526 RepID=A0ABM1VDJ3_SOLPN|nr:protein decapping 5-like isoform X1 [Solanum pennellii]XP_015077238.1 protein decapping 5-like isoform X1 [Solanum pennellii]XP_027773811.1 protein decapping 5-like isoform X1 [Solanum pennellii]
MATAASKAADSYIGSLICLITKSDIRYEGFLFHLDAAESTIGLRNVKSYGSEGRKKDGPQISPSDKIYEYIFFRGSDIKDLQVISSPSPQSTAVVPDDPAIIQTHFPNPTPPTIGMTSPGAVQVADVSTSAPSMLPVAPFLLNLPPNPLLPSSNLWGSSLPPPPVNISGPAVPNYWPGLVGSSGGVSHYQQQQQQQHFPPPPQSLVASLPIQQQAQHQNVNALAGGSSLAAQHHPLLLPISTTSPNLLPAMPSPSGQSNPRQPAKPAFNLLSIPMPNDAFRTLSTVAVDSCPRTVASLEAELNANANLTPVRKEPSSVISPSGSFPTFSQTVSSIVDTKGASLSNLSRQSLLTPEVQSGEKDSSSSRSMQNPNFDVYTGQASVSEPLPSGSTEETLESLPKSPTKILRGSTSSHHSRSYFAQGRDGAHQDTSSTHHNSRGPPAHRGNVPNGGPVYAQQSYRKYASGRGNGLIGAALHSRQSNMVMGRGKVPNGVPQHNHRSIGIQFRDGVTQHNHRNTGIQFRDGVPQHNHRNTGSHFRGRGAKNPLVTKRFSEDFDFEAMNEKFNKKEVWDFLGRSNKDESDEGIGDEKEMDGSDAEDATGDGSAKHDNKSVYCKEDFYDSLSCHALDRESGKVKFSDQRKKDVETFGEIQKNPRGRSQGARMSGGLQQSYRGRGYDNARGGRGQGRTVWGRVT